MGSSPTRGSSFFLGKVTALGVLCCFALFVCLTLLASFFLPSHLSFKNMYVYFPSPPSSHMCALNEGVPLMHIVSNTMVLENPTRVSQKTHDEVTIHVYLH